MNIDEKIKQELLQESQELDSILKSDRGLIARTFDTYKGNMRYWMVIVTFAALAATIAFVWFFYQFYLATNSNDKIFWGICFIAMLMIQVMLKLWTFMEMNRTSTLREIKRIEFAIERLEQTIQKSS